MSVDSEAEMEGSRFPVGYIIINCSRSLGLLGHNALGNGEGGVHKGGIQENPFCQTHKIILCVHSKGNGSHMFLIHLHVIHQNIIL